MPRVPTKSFELEIAPLLLTQLSGLQPADLPVELSNLLPLAVWQDLQQQSTVPLGLRWRLEPNLGLPRSPFQVWRRTQRGDDPNDRKFEGTDLPGAQIAPDTFLLPGAPYYTLTLFIKNNGSSLIDVYALDEQQHVIPLQTVKIGAGTSVVRFQHPFMYGFALGGGSFEVLSVLGVTMQHYANLDDWELVETVGLPVDKNEINGYDTQGQGRPGQLLGGPDAALHRLKIAQLFYQNLDQVFPSGENLPSWTIPSSDQALEELRDGNPALLTHVADMLAAVDGGTIATQADYLAKITGTGFHQTEFPEQASDEVTISVPLLASFLINSAVDPWFALTSGFGTTDFPAPRILDPKITGPKGYFLVDHDYMVSSSFRFLFANTFDFKVEYCALSHLSPVPPMAANQLEADLFFQNRPTERDAPFSAELALTWQRINRLQIQGYAIGLSEDGGNGTLLNGMRTQKYPTPALYVPMRPGADGDQSLQDRNRFIHHKATLPFVGTQLARYGVAAMDAFARWSSWRTVDLSKTPPLPEAPRLMSIDFNPDLSTVNENQVEHHLTFEIVWDWQDRSPKQFEVAGVFHRRLEFPDGSKDDGHLPPANYPSVFQTDAGLSMGLPLLLTFPSDIPPDTAPAFDSRPESPLPSVDVTLLPQATDNQGNITDGLMRRYRVVVSGMQIAFAPNEEWFFTLYIKGSEWRNSALFSDSTPPLLPNRPPRLTAYIPNPIPPPPPVFEPATVIWSTLPDARGKSRYRIAFPALAEATGGYAVFQAFEAKLRDIVGLPYREDPDLISRATELRDVVMPDSRSLDAFNRINTQLIPPQPAGTLIEYELEIPGTLDSLTAFAVQSVSKEQESSPLSTPWLVVAVPRRAVPVAPTLKLQQQNGVSNLLCEFPSGPFKPARVELLRTRKTFPARSVDTMGQPIHLSDPTAWQSLDASGKPTDVPGDISAFQFDFSEGTPPSWFPYYYRAVAIGPLDLDNGLIPGRSSQSNLITIEHLPKSLPRMQDIVAEQIQGNFVRLQFTTDAIVQLAPKGSFRLEISSWDFQQQIFPADPLVAMGLPNARPYTSDADLTANQVYYTDSSAEGWRQIIALLPVPGGDRYLYRIRLEDPLTRRSERTVSGKIQPVVPPHLTDLEVVREGYDLKVFFRSTSPIYPPPFGSYTLEIELVSFSTSQVTLLKRIALHEVSAGDINLLGSKGYPDLVRDERIKPVKGHQYGAYYRLKSLPAILRRHLIRVRLTGPKGAPAEVQAYFI